MLNKCQLLINPYYLKTMFCCQNVLKLSDLVLFSYFVGRRLRSEKGNDFPKVTVGFKTDVSLGALSPPQRQVPHPLFLFCCFVGLLFSHHQSLRSGLSSTSSMGPREERET